MNMILWILQVLLAIVFLYSGFCKSAYPRQKLVEMGQTGVADLPLPMIRFIGIAEILGAAGLILPMLLNIYPALTPVAGFFLALIMPFAAWIHYKRKEYKNVMLNGLIFLLCLLVAVGRL